MKKKPGGRSEYTEEIGLRICAMLASGEPLTAICKRPRMPGVSTVYAWREVHPEFDRTYERARQDMAHTLADEILQLADDASQDVIGGEANYAAVNRSRLKVDARKWVASKLLPRVYADRTEIVGAGGASLIGPIPESWESRLEQARLIAFALSSVSREMDEHPEMALLPAPIEHDAETNVVTLKPVAQ